MKFISTTLLLLSATALLVNGQSPTDAPTVTAEPTNTPTQTSPDLLGNPPRIAYYLTRTDVEDVLKQDQVQLVFENKWQGGTCEQMLDAEAYYNGIGGKGKGFYLQQIPTYRGSMHPGVVESWKYFGTREWLNGWVKPAFNKSWTDYPSGRGNGNFTAGFGGEGNEGKDDPIAVDKGKLCVGYQESIKKVLSYVSTVVQSLQYMQEAIDRVDEGCLFYESIDTNRPQDFCQDAINAWDKAVAVYVGSLEQATGTNFGVGQYGMSIYGLADKRCDEFETCGPPKFPQRWNEPQPTPDPERRDLAKPAYSNMEVMSLFSSGAYAAIIGASEVMHQNSWRIYQKAGVPLIQGVLRYAYKQSRAEDAALRRQDKYVGEGISFLMGVLGRLWACSEKAAFAVHRQMEVGGPVAGTKAVTFDLVRLAMECNYRCMGITCQDVGPLVFELANTDKFGERPACNDVDMGSSPTMYLQCRWRNKKQRRRCARYATQGCDKSKPCESTPGIPGRDRYNYIAPRGKKSDAIGWEAEKPTPPP